MNVVTFGRARRAEAPAGEALSGGDLHLEGITHEYSGVAALSDVSLSVTRGEFATLLGPSGCGKTTLLRLIAGFMGPTKGVVRLDGKDITSLPPYKRPVGMVFQRPTLFPHLNVERNIAFGLRLRRVDKQDVQRRVEETLELIGLEGFGPRRADELSGGQMQRIALARALIMRPEVLLLDEPLSALDLRVRLDMEVELRRVHRETGATFIYVTHDQREALALSDRIAVFNSGRIEQAGSPQEIYRDPRSAFAASFVGAANVVPCEVEADPDGAGRSCVLGAFRVPLDAGQEAPSGPAWMVLRPETVRVAPPGDEGPWPSGRVSDLAFRGGTIECHVALSGLEDAVKVEMRVSEMPPVAIGDMVNLQWSPSAIQILKRTPPQS